jgi:hypothetical protein
MCVVILLGYAPPYKDRDTRDFYQALKDKADAKQNAIMPKVLAS